MTQRGAMGGPPVQPDGMSPSGVRSPSSRPADRYYVLDGHKAVPTADVYEWAAMLEKPERVVAQTLVGGCQVSTVFLGLDHNFSGEGPPLIFETMVKNPSGGWEDFQERYSTENDAIIGHLEAVEE